MSDSQWKYGFGLTVVSLCSVFASAALASSICGDVNDSDSLTVNDALSVLRAAVGQSVELICAPQCGNGEVDSPEQCEAGNLANQTCATRGFAGGELACATGCTFDTSRCYAARFDSSGPTIIDHETGLEWEKKDALDDVEDLHNVHDADNYYTWSSHLTDDSAAPTGTAFLNMLAILNGAVVGDVTKDPVCYNDHCDWRIPTIEELATIAVPYPDCEAAPCVVDPAFQPMASALYWSITTELPHYAFAIDFGDGKTLADTKALDDRVRAVRGTRR